MKHSRFLILGLAICLLGAAHADAQADKGLFITSKWGKTDAGGSIGNVFESVVDGKDDARAYEVGWRFSKLVGLQVGYHDLGTLSGGGGPCPVGDLCPLGIEVPTQASIKAYSVAFVPKIPLTRSFSLFVKVGVVALESDVSEILDDTTEFIESISEEDIIYGAGLKMRFIAGLSLFYEYEFLGSDLEIQSLGVSWQF